MHPVRKQRLWLVLFLVVFSSSAIGLMAYAPVSYTHLTLPTNREV